jgi:hypothetical protein
MKNDYVTNVSPMSKERFKRAVFNLQTILMSLNLEYVALLDAPNTFEKVKQSFLDTNLYIVYSGGSENTIFTDKKFNYLFRAWHDALHIKNNLSFSFKDETILGNIQANEARNIAIELKMSLEEARDVADVVHAEVVGQIEYYQVYRNYVDDQKKYVMGYLGVK